MNTCIVRVCHDFVFDSPVWLSFWSVTSYSFGPGTAACYERWLAILIARRAPVSFGLAHVSPDDIVAAFPEFVEAVEECPPNCGHRGPPEEPDCMLDVVTADGEASAGRLALLRRLLASRAGIDEPSEG